jgi:hypothetical protein
MGPDALPFGSVQRFGLRFHHAWGPAKGNAGSVSTSVPDIPNTSRFVHRRRSCFETKWRRRPVVVVER